jgi:hypothetical protein
MKWGVRNKKLSGGSKSEKNRSRNRKIAVGVGAGIGLAAIGAAFIAKNINTNQKIADFSRMNENIRALERELHFSRNLDSPFRSGLKDQLQTLKENRLRATIGEKHFKAIVLGPKGSTSVARIKGAIPLPKAEDLKLHADKLRLEGKADAIMERRRETESAYQEYLKKRNIRPNN